MAQDRDEHRKNVSGNVTGRSNEDNTTDTRNRPSQKDKTEDPAKKDTQE